MLKETILFLPFLLGLFLMDSVFALDNSQDADRAKDLFYQRECRNNSHFLVKGQYQVTCDLAYHHYNATAFQKYYDKSKARTRNGGEVHIAGFNLWHPGSSKSFYKDYALIAKIIDQWDVIGATELLPLVGKDAENNQRVIKFLADAPDLIQFQEEKIRLLKERASLTPRMQKDLEIREAKLAKLISDLQEAPTLYRKPGYLKILDALRKRDASWSLLLSPRGEAAKETDVQELAGFFYRARKVRPFINRYCKTIKEPSKAQPYACIPKFDGSFLDRPYRHVFSRRPFLANFEAGHFDFTLVTSHIVFNSPSKTEDIENILMPTFNQPHYDLLGEGVTKMNYARFAEVKATLELMNKMRESFAEKDIIMVGDFNLEDKNPFWEPTLNAFPGSELVVKEPSSVTISLNDKDGHPTNGYSSNYDHFIIDGEMSHECRDNQKQYKASRYDFYNGKMKSAVHKKYRLRSTWRRNKDQTFKTTYFGRWRRGNRIEELTEFLNQRKTISNNVIVIDQYKREKRVEDFNRRVFESQLSDSSFYRFYMELISDHAPISMTCRSDKKDDDQRLLPRVENLDNPLK